METSLNIILMSAILAVLITLIISLTNKNINIGIDIRKEDLIDPVKPIDIITPIKPKRTYKKRTPKISNNNTIVTKKVTK